MDQLLKDFGNTLSGLFSSELVQLAMRAIGIYVVFLWLATAFWAYQDMKSRTVNPLLPYLAAALIIVFTPLLFLFAALLYRIIRPHERVGEAHERMLAEEAMLAEVEQLDHCLGCGRRTEDGWLVCPTCRTRLRRVCPNCGKLVGTDWLLCAWCGTDFEVPQPRGVAGGVGPYAVPPTTYRPTGRPAVRPAAPAAAVGAGGTVAPTPVPDRYTMASPAPAPRPEPRPALDDVPPVRDDPRPVPSPSASWAAPDDLPAPGPDRSAAYGATPAAAYADRAPVEPATAHATVEPAGGSATADATARTSADATAHATVEPAGGRTSADATAPVATSRTRTRTRTTSTASRPAPEPIVDPSADTLPAAAAPISGRRAAER